MEIAFIEVLHRIWFVDCGTRRRTVRRCSYMYGRCARKRDVFVWVLDLVVVFPIPSATDKAKNINTTAVTSEDNMCTQPRIGGNPSIAAIPIHQLKRPQWLAATARRHLPA